MKSVWPFSIRLCLRAFLVLSLSLPRTSAFRLKRIVHGRQMPSHDLYRTNFFVQLRKVWECDSDQINHVMLDCRTWNVCGGSLINPQFVVTACSCITYEDFYITDKLPPIEPALLPQERRRRAEGDVMKDNNWLTNVLVKQEPFHPMLTTMGLYAGSTYVREAKQKRHAKAFFPHSLCRQRQKDTYAAWESATFEHDIGLVLTCKPFEINRDVGLAPMDANRDTYESILKRSAVCMFMGFGKTEENEHVDDGSLVGTELLRYIWRYMMCHAECRKYQKCVLCSSHFRNFSYVTFGDEGGPIMCDRAFIGVITRHWSNSVLKQSRGLDYPLACVNSYLKKSHLDQLAARKPEDFHHFEGPKIHVKAYSGLQMTSSTQTIFLFHLEFLNLVTVIFLWGLWELFLSGCAI